MAVSARREAAETISRIHGGRVHLQGFVFSVQWEAMLLCPLYFPPSFSFSTVCSNQILLKQEYEQTDRWSRGHRYHPGTSKIFCPAATTS